MDFLSKTLSIISPNAAYKREISKLKLRSLGSFEAASKKNQLRNWGINFSQNEAMDKKTLSERSWYLVKNNPHARSALRGLTSHIIGEGIIPHSKDKKVDFHLKMWADSTECDFFGEQNLYGLQTTLFKHLVLDGEVFVQKIYDKNSTFPLKLRVISSSKLDDMNQGTNIKNGIEYDNEGKKVAYYFKNSTVSGLFKDSIKIHSKDIVHIFDKDHSEDVTGFSWFSSFILKLKYLDDYEDTEIIRQNIAACFVGFYRDLEPSGEDPFEDKSNLATKLQPGTILKAPSGQTIEFANPPQTSGFSSFTDASKMSVSAGSGVPYMIVTGDYSRANYSSSRNAMLNFNKYCSCIQKNVLLPKLKIIEKWFLDALEIAGTMTHEPIVWSFPPKDFVDPLKDIAARKASVEEGFRSHADVIRELGQDPDDVYKEIEENNKILNKLGLKVDAKINTVRK